MSPSVTSSYNNNDDKYGADNAIDGNTDGDFNGDSCIFTSELHVFKDRLSHRGKSCFLLKKVEVHSVSIRNPLNFFKNALGSW